MNFSLILTFVFVALISAQTPHKPKWPARFSATISIDGWEDNRGPRFSRWFYDAAQNKDRLDGYRGFEQEGYFVERIFDHAKKTEYDIAFQPNSVICSERTINGTIPRPDFTSFVYAGKALLDYQDAYVWTKSSNGNAIFEQYWDSQEKGKPLRYDLTDNTRKLAVTIIFYEFDECNQDPQLFEIPAAILAQCNKA